MATHPRLSTRPAFTLVELLVVIAIIGVLLALTLCGVQAARRSALRAACLSQLRQFGLACHQYHGNHNAFPVGVVRPYNPSFPYLHGPREDAYPMMTWLTRVLPYLEQDSLWKATLDAYGVDVSMGDEVRHVGYTTPVKLFVCPADTATRALRQSNPLPRTPTSYLGVGGTNQFRRDGVLIADAAVRFADITDGTSNTLMVGERPFDIGPGRTYGAWYGGWGSFGFGGVGNSVLGVRESGVLQLMSNPNTPCSDGPYAFGGGSLQDPCSVFHFWSFHGGGANFLFGDGSARFLPYSASAVLPALASRAGGEVLPSD